MSPQPEVMACGQAAREAKHSSGVRVRNQLLPERGPVRLGMPHLGLSGLSENWLLRECGDRHWQAVCEIVGVPSHRLCNRAGHRLYSSFIATEISGDPLGAFGENDTLSFAIRITRLSPYRFFSSQHVVCASEARQCTVNMMTLFVRKETFEDNHNLTREAVPLSCAPDFRIAEPADAFTAERLQLAHRHLKDAPPACLPSEYIYDICPLTDFNAARFLYFAGYQAILDRAEWYLLRRPGLEFSSTVHRQTYYFANVNIGDRAIVKIGGFRQDGANYRFDAVLTRGSDGSMIACAESVRTLQKFGEAAKQGARGLDSSADCGAPRSRPTRLNRNIGDHEDISRGLVASVGGHTGSSISLSDHAISDHSPSLTKLTSIIELVSGTPITAVDANLIDLGVNSISMLAAVATIESEFDVEFNVDDLTRANFSSVHSILRLIQRTQAARASATPHRASAVSSPVEA